MSWKCPHCKIQISDHHRHCPKCHRERPSASRSQDDDDDDVLDTIATAVGIGNMLPMGSSEADELVETVTGGGGSFGGGGASGSFESEDSGGSDSDSGGDD